MTLLKYLKSIDKLNKIGTELNKYFDKIYMTCQYSEAYKECYLHKMIQLLNDYFAGVDEMLNSNIKIIEAECHNGDFYSKIEINYIFGNNEFTEYFEFKN